MMVGRWGIFNPTFWSYMVFVLTKFRALEFRSVLRYNMNLLIMDCHRLIVVSGILRTEVFLQCSKRDLIIVMAICRLPWIVRAFGAHFANAARIFVRVGLFDDFGHRLFQRIFPSIWFCHWQWSWKWGCVTYGLICIQRHDFGFVCVEFRSWGITISFHVFQLIRKTVYGWWKE